MMPRSLNKPVKVYLGLEQIEALRALGLKRGLSVSELIRQSVEQLLIEIPLEDDPLWNIVGLGGSGVSDLSVDHDRYLAEIEESGNSPASQ